MIDCLFVGSFLSGNKGSLSVSEFVAQQLGKEGMSTRLVSYRQNKLLRLAEIVLTILFTRAKTVHIEVYSGAAFRIAEIASACARLGNTPVILTLHGGKLPEFAQANKKRIERLFSRASRIATPSLYLRQFFEQQGHEIGYLPNSIDLERFPYNRDHVKPYSLLWVRAFGTIYNPAVAVKALYETRKQHPSATLTMVGPDGGILDDIKTLIGSLQLEKAVTLTGPVANTALKAYYQSHGIYLNTTSYESFGVAVIEAASCGTPVISTAVGEIPFLWEHEKNMLLVNAPDEHAFAREINKLFSDPALSTKISAQARAKALLFDWKNIKQLWHDILSN